MNNPGPVSAAALGSPGYGGHLAARLLEFTADTTPWQRRLWCLGTVLALRETCEAGQWIDAQVISPAALQWLCRDLERTAGDDSGIGEPEVRRQLRDALHANLSEHSRHRRRLQELTLLIENSYIPRWAEAANTPRGVSPERLARALAAHLLDRGYSTGFLHRVVRQRIAQGATVGDLLDEAAVLASASLRQFDVLVPFIAVPQQQLLAENLPQWRSGPKVREWLAEHAAADTPRQNGGFLPDGADAAPGFQGRRTAGAPAPPP